MSISIYNYSQPSNTFTPHSYSRHPATSHKSLRIVKYVVKSKLLTDQEKHKNRAIFKLTSVSSLKLARKQRQKTRLRKKEAAEMLKQPMHHRYSSGNNNANNHSANHVNNNKPHLNQQLHQYQPQSYHLNYNSNPLQFGAYPGSNFSSVPFFQQHQQPTAPSSINRRTSFVKQSAKSKCIKIGNRANNNGAAPAPAAKQFSFQSSSSASVPSSANGESFTSLMSASFGVNPGVAAAAAAACATLAQLLRSDLTINLAKDQPRLVISGPSIGGACQQQQQQQRHQPSFFNCKPFICFTLSLTKHIIIKIMHKICLKKTIRVKNLLLGPSNLLKYDSIFIL